MRNPLDVYFGLFGKIGLALVIVGFTLWMFLG